MRCQTCLSILQRVQPAFARSAKVRFFCRIIANCCQLNALRLYILSSKREKVFKLQVDIAGKKKNYGKAISSFPFFWLYFIIRIYEYDIKVKLFFLLAAIIMENVKIYPYLGADYVKYMLKRSKNGFLSIFFDRNIPSYEKNE